MYGISPRVLAKIANGEITIPVKEYATDPEMDEVRVKSDVDTAFDKNLYFDRAGTSSMPEPGIVHRHLG